MGGTNLAGN